MFRVHEIRCYERPVRLRLPFRFGNVTVTTAPQAFVRVRIGFADGRESWGTAAELMVPKWFDKSAALTEADSIEQLRVALGIAREAYLADGQARTAFGHFASHYRELVEQSPKRGLPPLAACFGPAEIDKAIADALGRATQLGFGDLVRRNVLGVAPEALLSEFAGFDYEAFARTLDERRTVAVRHTVGMLDTIEGDPHDVADGLPESLEAAIAAYGLAFFKLKLGGDAARDLARLEAIAAVLGRCAPDFRVTLDGNEQYDSVDRLLELWREACSRPVLAQLAQRTLFIEQPIRRESALQQGVRTLAALVPVIIDESDATLDAFGRARDLGYAGVSSKACKGLYKSLFNRARCVRWNDEAREARWFMSGEDLTTQAGLAVQQDLALAAVLGLEHVERNGHHYVDGFAGQGATPAEQHAFLAAHPDLYEERDGNVRLRIVAGEVAIASLHGPGFAAAAQPDISSMKEMNWRRTAGAA